MEAFKEKVERLFQKHEELITRKNVAVEDGNDIFTRYKYPVVTAAIHLYSGGMIWMRSPTRT